MFQGMANLLAGAAAPPATDMKPHHPSSGIE
jgi:hypothetical protein